MNRLLNLLYNLFGLVCFGAFFTRAFFYISAEWVVALSSIAQVAMLLLLLTEATRYFFCKNIIELMKDRRIELGISVFIFLYLIISHTELSFLPDNIEKIVVESLPDITLAYLGMTSLFVVSLTLIDAIKKIQQIMEFKLSTNAIFVLSFFTAIALGTVLLKLPRSSHESISWVDAFFTATSAICVTGLTTFDISSQLTTVGQTVVMIGFQIGGLGIMTMTMLFASLFKGGLALGETLLLKEMFDTKNVSEASRIFRRVTLWTLSIEFIGFWILLNARMGQGAELSFKLFYECLFHAISAFCNAGFSLFTGSLTDNMVLHNNGYIFTIMFLIVLGGLGFPVLISLWNYLGQLRLKREGPIPRISTHSKIVLTATFLLLGFGTLFIYLTEMNQSFSTLSQLEKIRQSLFLSVTSRTAGFNLWPTESLGIGTMSVLILLMWIGGAPISTAGGIKCTTFYVAIVQMYNHLKGKAHCEIFEREISQITIQRAFTVIFGSVMIIMFSFLVLVQLNPHINAGNLLFESFSAWGTVGLSRGITSSLTEESKILLSFLMFCGRVGFFTLFSLFVKDYKDKKYRYLKDHITVY